MGGNPYCAKPPKKDIPQSNRLCPMSPCTHSAHHEFVLRLEHCAQDVTAVRVVGTRVRMSALVTCYSRDVHCLKGAYWNLRGSSGW